MIEFLKGKKTYILVAAGFIYGGLIQIGVMKHYPFVDAALAGGTIASLRAGIAKDAAKLILIGWAALSLPGCVNGPIHPNSALAVVGGDFVRDASNALQAYADYKAGNVNFTWALQKAFNAYADSALTSADVKALVQAWLGNAGDSKALADRLARIFASDTSPPDVKMQALASIATNVASNKGP